MIQHLGYGDDYYNVLDYNRLSIPGDFFMVLKYLEKQFIRFHTCHRVKYSRALFKLNHKEELFLQ